ncbi:hypothetical protein HK099_000209 [Clydaea vesicula]|uniref:Uncharacterized protein n=1 Tax=Clydaea vesicula TaxID=447962 RepID=A0AAD5TVC4_9FUNG|nr:hypothetical protein HK099_000209 [Clydaea vesicula]
MGDLLGFLNRNRRCEMHIPVASGSCFLDSLLELEGNSKEKFARCDFFFKNYDAKSLHKCCKYHVEDRDAGIFQQLIIEDRKVETSTKTNFNVSESEEEDEDEEKKGKNLKKRKYNDTFNDLIFQKNVNKEIKIQLENLRKENQKLIFQKRNLSEHKRELNKDLKELEEEVAVTKTAIKAAKKKNKELKKGFEKVKKGKETTWDSDSSESECEFNDTHLEAMKKLADDVEENDNILAENLPKAHVKKLLIEKRQWNRLLTGMTRQLLELRSETSNCNCRFASGAVDAAVSISNSASARAQFMELLGEASVNVSDEEAENIYQILMALFAELFDRDSLTVEEGRFLKKTSSKQILSFIGGLYPRKTRQGSTIVGTFSKCIPEDIHFSCYIKLEKLLTYIPLEVIVHLFSAFKADS